MLNDGVIRFPASLEVMFVDSRVMNNPGLFSQIERATCVDIFQSVSQSWFQSGINIVVR